MSCDGSGRSGQLAAQHVRLALQPARLLRQGARVFPQAPARHDARRAGQGSGRGGRAKPKEVAGTTRRRRENSTCWSRSISACPRPASIPTSCCRPRPGTRRTTSTPPTCTPSSTRCRGGGSGLGGAQRLGDLQGIAKTFSESRRSAGRREGCGADADPARQRRRDWRSRSTSRTGRRASASRFPARPCRSRVVERDYPNSTSASPRSGR
jgi:hypothetical protein